MTREMTREEYESILTTVATINGNGDRVKIQKKLKETIRQHGTYEQYLERRWVPPVYDISLDTRPELPQPTKESMLTRMKNRMARAVALSAETIHTKLTYWYYFILLYFCIKIESTAARTRSRANKMLLGCDPILLIEIDGRIGDKS